MVKVNNYIDGVILEYKSREKAIKYAKSVVKKYSEGFVLRHNTIKITTAKLVEKDDGSISILPY